MKRIGFFAALAVLGAGTAYAQTQRVDPAVPSPLPETRVEASGELKTLVPPRPLPFEMHGQSDVDARHCLDLTTNMQVHQCAERYRHRATRSRAKAAAKVAPTSAKAKGNVLDIPKTAEPPKPGGAQKKAAVSGPDPADTAKAADIVKPMDVTKPPAAPKAEAAKGVAASPAGKAAMDAAKAAAVPRAVDPTRAK